MDYSLKTLTALFTGLYFIALVAIAYASYIKEPSSRKSYIIGDRRIGVLGTLSSLAAGQFSGAVIFIFFSLAPVLGYGLMWMPIGATLGMLCLGLHLKSVRESAEKHDYVTLSDLVEDRIGHRTGMMATIIISLKAMLLVASQLYISGNIFASLFGIPPFVSILAVALCVMLYLLLGGYLTVIRTDVLQIFLMLVAIIGPLITFGMPANHDVFKELTAGHPKAFELFVFIFLMAYSNAEMWQRMFSVSCVKRGLRGFLLGGPVLMSLVFCAITFALIAYGDGNSALGVGKDAFFMLFTQSAFPATALALLCVFVTSAIMSTIDTQAYLFASTLSKNVFKSGGEDQHERFVFLSRAITVVMLLCLAIAASTIGDILGFIFKAVSAGFILIPALSLGCARAKKTSSRFDVLMTLAIFIGLGIYAYMFTHSYFDNPLNTAIPPLVVYASFAMLYGLSKTGEMLYLMVRPATASPIPTQA